MQRNLILGVCLGAFVISPVLAEDLPPAATGTIDYETQIKPIFESKCLDCHGEDTQEGKFRLDRKSSLVRGGDSGEPAILPGNSAESHLIRLVSGMESGLVMPPEGNDRLTGAEIGLLRAWIDQGAVWPGAHGAVGEEKTATDHWSFQPLAAVVPPALQSEWIRNPIDAFVLDRLHQHHLQQSPPADRRTLIRRIYLDMLGLPPTPEQVQAYVEDESADATQKLIEQVLESPHYGERQARYWLDLVRFAETYGFETNRERPYAWHYRDYVIESFNSDKPYDQFVKEQLAGDTFGDLRGLGYLVAGASDQVKSPDVNLTLMQRQNELDDMINTTGTVFQGLTLGCARCHNHKFDPITQTDYYALQAIFAGVNHADLSLPLLPEQEEERLQLQTVIADLERQLGRFRNVLQANGTVEAFPPHRAKYVRFVIEATNSAQPCLDELEVFSGDRNVALAKHGSQATASGSLSGYAIHKLKHIHDGRYGNSFSWISNEPSRGWVQIEFPRVELIDHIEWARDREGRFSDRLATQYYIESSLDGQEWKRIASSQGKIPIGELKKRTAAEQFGHLPPEQAEAARQILKKLEPARQRMKDFTESLRIYAGNYSQPGPTHRLFRGEPMMKREQVTPDVPAVFDHLNLAADLPEKERRKALAEWITAPQNPLTARVIVNRLWQYDFGRGLVDTASDFGASGSRPTHPELLDWLAGELITRKWSLKEIHRLILNSATYQQASLPLPEALLADAGAQFLWRYPPRRLEAEPIRDSILSVTGVLELKQKGPGFSLFEIEAENVRHYNPKTSFGPPEWRRMIYMTKVRMEQDAVFGVFDCPDGATSVPRRTISTTPLQALNLFNSTFLIQQSELFAKRLERDAPEDRAAQVRRAYALCYSRPASDDEVNLALKFVTESGLPAFCRAVLNSNEFLFIQ